MRKLIRIIEKTIDILSGFIPAWTVFILMVMVLVEVFSRYVLHSPLSIAEEYGGFMLVGLVFLGLAYTWKEQGHVKVEIVLNILSPKMRRRLRFFTLILATLFCYPLIAGCYELLQDSLLFGSKSGSWMRTPLVYPQSLLLIGSILLFVQLLVEIAKQVIAFRSESKEEI